MYFEIQAIAEVEVHLDFHGEVAMKQFESSSFALHFLDYPNLVNELASKLVY